MKHSRVLLSLVVLALVAVAVPASFAAPAAPAAVAHAAASPFLKLGPQAVPADVAAPAGPGIPSYGLFTCQLAGAASVCYDPYQMRHAYGTDALINAGFTGKGKTIVIVDAYQSPNIVQQLNYYDNFYGLSGLNGLGNPQDNSLGTFTQYTPDGVPAFDPNDGNMIGWAEEISLDVLWAHAIAPGANIALVLAKSNNDDDILSATKYAVDHNLGDVISQSFGENESCMASNTLAAQHQVFADATRKGITLFASSGDSDAAQGNCDGTAYVKAASSPASDPLVTAVGGTELHAAGYCLPTRGCDPAQNPAAGTYQGEIVWNETNLDVVSIGTGGGFSVLYDEPSYQQGTINGGKQLGVPDVSYNAAVLHGVLTYLNIPGIPAGMYRFGGTSAGSPQWAALTAIADQKAGRDLGFINRALFTIGQAQAKYAASMHDITTGNNSLIDTTTGDTIVQGFNATPGWDAATGLGSPKTAQLISNLAQLVAPGDATAAIAQSAHQHGTPPVQGHVSPH